jgi:hypothetical protein
MPRFTVQRPATIWIETVVEDSATLEDAIEMADEQFEQGDYIEIQGTWDIDDTRYWSQDELGEVKYA